MDTTVLGLAALALSRKGWWAKERRLRLQRFTMHANETSPLFMQSKPPMLDQRLRLTSKDPSRLFSPAIPNLFPQPFHIFLEPLNFKLHHKHRRVCGFVGYSFGHIVRVGGAPGPGHVRWSLRRRRGRCGGLGGPILEGEGRAQELVSTIHVLGRVEKDSIPAHQRGINQGNGAIGHGVQDKFAHPGDIDESRPTSLASLSGFFFCSRSETNFAAAFL